MIIKANTINEYIDQIPQERKLTFNKLFNTIKENIPKGFEATISYNFPSFVVPHSIYPNGYHCKPEEPLPFISIASQKNFISFYHMGLYSNPELLEWFKLEYSKLNIGRLDMGKSCIRFKNVKKIPFDLLAQLCTKIDIDDWIKSYELSRQSH